MRRFAVISIATFLVLSMVACSEIPKSLEASYQLSPQMKTALQKEVGTFSPDGKAVRYFSIIEKDLSAAATSDADRDFVKAVDDFQTIEMAAITSSYHPYMTEKLKDEANKADERRSVARLRLKNILKDNGIEFDKFTL